MTRRNRNSSGIAIVGLLFACTTAAVAQSSSLFLEGEQTANERAASSQPARSGPVAGNAGTTQPYDAVANNPLNETSFIAVAPPKPRTFKVHDAVTIIVLERVHYKSDNQFQQDKRWDFDQKLSAWLRIHENKLVEQPFKGGTPEMALQTNDRRTGNGRQTREDEFSTRITGEVMDVKPNGQLVLMASKRIKYGEEVQKTVLLARCRGQDVTTDNSILSTQLLDPDIVTDQDGQVTDSAKRGWLQKLFDKIRPF